MSELPRLPAPLEHHVLKWACGLSPRTSRAIFGRPPTIDGQTLSTETHALLTLARWSGSNGFFAGKTVPEARARASYESSVSPRRPPLPMAEIRPLDVPGPGGPLPSRLYVPHRPGAEGRDVAAMLVYYHGGGWVIRDLDVYDGVCRVLAAASGCSILS